MKRIKRFFKTRKSYHYVRYSLYATLMILSLVFPWLLAIISIALFIALLIVLLSNAKLIKRSKGNGIKYGSRGSGKGQLLNRVIFKDKTKPFVNVPYHLTLVSGNYLYKMFHDETIDKDAMYVLDASNDTYKVYVHGMYYHTELLENISEYFNSIKPLDIESFIKGDITAIPKLEKFEGRNVYIDDINVYMPNWADSLLKNKYPSMPPMLAINRHLYNAYCVITTQDRERPYKILKELQSDFSIKAKKTYGYGWLWKACPFVHPFAFTSYTWHELPKSSDMQPFKAVGAINEVGKHAYLTSGQATKEVYEATNGKIENGFVLQLKKNVSYDTRYFHKVVYGVKAPSKV